MRHHRSLRAQVSAGNQLFHVVVDNDNVATRITALLTEQRAGRVTFIPLNRINPQPVRYPDFGDDALPLVNKINCAEQHKKAVAQVRPCPLLCRVICTADACICQEVHNPGGTICRQMHARQHAGWAASCQGLASDRCGACFDPASYKAGPKGCPGLLLTL